MECEISAVVPVYRSEKTLRELHERLTKSLEALSPQYEIIMVEDAGGDGSWEIIEALCRRDPRLKGIKLKENQGQQKAIMLGLQQARGEWIVTLDDDLQNPPEEIPRLIAKLQEGYDLVYGVPREKKHSLWRRISARSSKWLIQKITGSKVLGMLSPFRAFKGGLIRSFREVHSSFVSLDAQIARVSEKTTSIEVLHEERRVGNSTYNFKKLLKVALYLVFAFTSRRRLLGLSSLPALLSVSGLLTLEIISHYFPNYFLPVSEAFFPFLWVLFFAQILMFLILGKYWSGIDPDGCV